MMILLLGFSDSGFGEGWQSQHLRPLKCNTSPFVSERSQSWQPPRLSLA
jgi:hypothetical protein